MSSDQKKKEKKLRKFQDTTQTAANRVKFLAEFSERSQDYNEVDSTFKSHHFDIMSLTHEAFNQYELQAKKGKYNEQGMQHVLSVMKLTMIHLQAQIAQRGGARTVVRMLETLLSPIQKHNIRSAALEILLLFYEALGDPEKEFVAILPAALDMTPYLPDFPGDTRFRVKPLPTELVMIPRDTKQPYTKEESLDLINSFLHFISEPNRVDKFQHWFSILRLHILPTLYPTICKQMGLLDAADDSGFLLHCPLDIQSTLIDYLATWCSNEGLNAFLWGEQAALMLEIYRQACLMPATKHESIKKAFLIFKDSLFTKVPKTINENMLGAFRKWYWEKLTMIVPDNALTADHYKLIAEALNLYSSIVDTIWTTLHSSVQDMILITALELATRAIKRPDSGAYDRNLCPILVESLLMLWINARVTDPNLWRALQERLRTFFHRKDAIIQCKFKLLQLTLVLENFMFSFEAHNKYEGKKAKQSTKRSESTFPDPVVTLDIRPDPMIKDMAWDWQSAQLVWFNLLEIFRYTNGLEDPGAYLESMDALTTTAELIISAYERADFEEPDPNGDITPGQPPPLSPSQRPSLSLISIFGPWLFEAAKRPVVYSDGKALANRTLCRLVVRQAHVNLPIALLAHFYDSVQISLLEFSCSKSAWAILEHSTAIFSLGLPGCNILIPYYLTEITKIFTKGDHISEKVRESALTILTSMISLPYHYNGLSIPFDVESSKHHKLAENITVSGVPSVPVPFSTMPNQLSYADIKPRLANLLMMIVNREPRVQLVCQGLNAISTLLTAEIYHPDTQSPELILTLIKAVMACTLKEHRIAYSALSCLSNLSSSYSRLHAIEPTIVSKVCYQLVLNLSTRQLSPGMELIMVLHYDTLLEWLSALPPSFFEDTKLFKKLFSVIDSGLRAIDAGSVPTPLSPSTKPEPAPDMASTYGGSTSAAQPSSNKLKLRRAAEQTLVFLSDLANNWPLDSHYDIIQSHLVDYIDDTPEKANAPINAPAGGAGNVTGSSDETPPPPPGESFVGLASASPYVKDTLWYSMNEKYLFSLVDYPFHSPGLLDTNDHQALAFCLASTHYIYFFRAFLKQFALADAISLYYEDQQYLASGLDRSSLFERCKALVQLALNTSALHLTPELATELKSKLTQPADVQLWYLLYVCFLLFKSSPYWNNSQEHLVRLVTRDYCGKFSWELTPCADWDNNVALRKQVKDARSAPPQEGQFDLLGGQVWRFDEISELSEPLQTEITDLEHLLTTYKQNPFGNSPDIFAPKQLTDENHNLLLEYAEAMNLQFSAVTTKLNELKAQTAPAYLCEPPQPATLLSHCHVTRLFLKQFGWLDPTKYGNFHMYEQGSARFKRLLKQLDTNTYGHEVTKIGLVYVKDGQENERAMLRNEEIDTSPLYREFVEGMATIAYVRQHCAYVGGLDRSGSVGITLPYWRNPLTELVIHEVTRMPTVHKDTQQILKKRHVGNDIVHLIWSEHCRDYKPHTIVSQFNDAHIMVFPLPNGLFRIKIAQKREVPPFGPLVHNVTIPKALLPLLSRQTAIAANSVVRFSHEAYLGQFAARKNGLVEILSKNARPAYHEYIAALFPALEST